VREGIAHALRREATGELVAVGMVLRFSDVRATEVQRWWGALPPTRREEVAAECVASAHRLVDDAYQLQEERDVAVRRVSRREIVRERESLRNAALALQVLGLEAWFSDLSGALRLFDRAYKEALDRVYGEAR
jgi:hypothetical protein